MKSIYFAQFYYKSAISDEIIEACGDRAVIQIDGRLSLSTKVSISRQECLKRGFKGFSVHHGTFLTSQVLKPFERV